MRAGFASAEITPDPRTRLFGVLEPVPELGAEGGPLYATAAWFDDGLGGQALLMSLDAIWVDWAFAEALSVVVASTYGVTPEAVLVTATHTHAAPQIHPGIHDGFPPDQAYSALLMSRAQEAARLAVAAAVPAVVELARGRVDVAINRRRSVLDPTALARGLVRRVVANRPNADALVDDLLMVLRVRAQDNGTLLGMCVNMACHPTAGPGWPASGDYPGALAEELALRHKGCATVFLQGFTGDQRPKLTRVVDFNLRHPLRSAFFWVFDRVHFVKNNPPEVVRDLARRVADVVDSAMPWRAVDMHISAAVKEIRLPLEKGDLPVRIQCLGLSRDTFLMCVEGEVFSSHARWLRSQVDASVDILSVGYSGGMVGYLPDSEALARGGYEPDRSLSLFGLPGRLAPDAPGALRTAMLELLRAAGGK